MTHEGTRQGPADRGAVPPARGALVELSHVIRAGMITYPGLPGPAITPYLTREASRAHYAPGTEFAIDRLTMIGNTGAAEPGIGVSALAALDVRGKAVLLHTGDSTRFGTPEYARDARFLTRDGAAWLVARDAALVGIDAVNIDDPADGERPAHSLLLAAGIPVVEHLTGLGQLPPDGAVFTAVPLRVEGLGTIPVRAFARLPG